MKMIVKVTMTGQKSRSKALKIAVGLSGVESATLKGDDKSQIEITGDGVDPVKLTRLLRKAVGHTELLSVAAAGGEKKDDQNKDESTEKDAESPVVYQAPYVYEVPYGYGYQQHQYECNNCSIM